MTTITKMMVMCATLLFCVATQATIIGSWQGSGSALTTSLDEGWIDWGNGLSITNTANTNKYQFVSGTVAGYGQSLMISQGGFNQSLAIKLENVPGGNRAFLNNYLIAFTFSVDPASVSGSTAGFSQLYQLVVNASGYGFQGQAFSTNTWTATGSTGNNGANGQPNYYFFGGAPARTQTVIFNYSNILSAITATTNSGYIELIFTFNNGGGAPTNFYINNVQLLGSAAQVPAGAIIVDDFTPSGVSPNNPANYDNYQSAQVYSTGAITNVYGSWFGGAFSSLSWDPNTDANNDPTSGSLMINLNWTNDNQFLVWDQGTGNNFFQLNINALQYTNFQCDVKFAPGSASDTGNNPTGQPIFGHLQFGDRTASYGQDYFGAVDVPATNTGWVHVSIPLNAISDPNLTNIDGLLIHIYSPFYGLNLTGTTTLWIDNIKFTGPTATVSNPPPTLAVQKAKSALRIFAGSTANTYDREELATVDNNQSWIGGTYPVSYSFNLLSYPANINQTHIFIVPTATSGQANMGNNGTLNEFIEFQATNMLWMVINPGAGGQVVASVQWKTNLPNLNPNQTALRITNSTAVGTWTLTFNSASTGTLTAPGAGPVAFTIGDPSVSTDFANPAVAYFGIQPNTTAGEGQFEDWGSITVSGVAGTAESENFAAEASFNPNNYWAINGANTSSVQFVPSSTGYWVNWTLPDAGFGLGTAMSVLGNTNTSGFPWVLPEFYNGYADGLNLPGTAQQGLHKWVQVPTNCLPTSDGTVGGPLSPAAFFKMFNPPLSN